jgi:hypothetical protein
MYIYIYVYINIFTHYIFIQKNGTDGQKHIVVGQKNLAVLCELSTFNVKRLRLEHSTQRDSLLSSRTIPISMADEEENMDKGGNNSSYDEKDGKDHERYNCGVCTHVYSCILIIYICVYTNYIYIYI